MGRTMASLIQELDNDALLLLYDADELPLEDRAELEVMLAADPGLRAGLAAVRRDAATAAVVMSALERADPAAGASAAGESAALRRLARAVRQWQVERLVHARPATAAAAGRQPRFPTWAYPAAAAASLVFATLAWWGWQGKAAPGQRIAGSTLMASKAGPGGGPASPRLLLMADIIGTDGEATPGLADAQRQANVLTWSGDASDGQTILRDGSSE